MPGPPSTALAYDHRAPWDGPYGRGLYDEAPPSFANDLKVPIAREATILIPFRPIRQVEDYAMSVIHCHRCGKWYGSRRDYGKHFDMQSRTCNPGNLALSEKQFAELRGKWTYERRTTRRPSNFTNHNRSLKGGMPED